MSKLLQVEQLQVRIGERSICAGLDWQVNRGQVWGVLGVNGVGKSTLLQTICGLRSMEGGTVSLNGKSLESMSRRAVSRLVGMLFQHQDDLFPATVFEYVMMGRHPHVSLLRGEQPVDFEIVQRAIDQVGLKGMERRMIDTLSGGERRRVAIATLVAQHPRLYLLDEPEAHLDPHHQQAIISRMVAQSRRQSAVVMALHDINLALNYCTHLMMMFGNGTIEQGTVNEMGRQERVERLYGVPMVRLEQEGRVAYLPQ